MSIFFEIIFNLLIMSMLCKIDKGLLLYFSVISAYKLFPFGGKVDVVSLIKVVFAKTRKEKNNIRELMPVPNNVEIRGRILAKEYLVSGKGYRHHHIMVPHKVR